MKRGRARWLAPALWGAIALAGATGLPTPAPAQGVLPPFTLFGWLSPPPESTTAARIAEMAELGLNVLLPSQDPAGHAPEANLRRVDLAGQHGMQVLLFDERLARAWRAGFFTPAGAGLRDLADEHGVPFWAIVQLTQHTGYRVLTTGELRWQVSNLLAYGARGIGYFTYWTPTQDPQWNWQPAIIGPHGERTETYEFLRAFHQRLRPAGELLAACRWISTQATAPVPPGADPFV